MFEKNRMTQIMQNIEKDMLKELAELLDRNNIPFYLAFGTALGCVRHQGFIPWDDDVDIYMRATDYARVKEIFATQDTGNLVLHDSETVKDYPYWFPKIVARDTILVEDGYKNLNYQCGVYIDVFLLIETSPNSVVRNLRETMRYFYYCMLKASYYDFGGKRKWLSKAVKLFSKPAFWQKRLLKIYSKAPSAADCYIDVAYFDQKAVIEKEYFKNICHMPFEDLMMPLMEDYEGYLRHCYGDYMQLPPEEQQVSNHYIHRLVINGEEVKDA